MICPRCRNTMVRNCYAEPGDWQCNRCGLVLVFNDDGEIVSTNEEAHYTPILDGANRRRAACGNTNGRYSFTPRSNYRLPKTTRSVLREAITSRMRT